MSTFPLSSTPLVGVCDEILGKSTTGGEDDVDINTSDTTTPTQKSDFWFDYSGSCAPTKQSGILIPSFLFILFRQYKRVFYFVA
jgi:hypothetical protein